MNRHSINTTKLKIHVAILAIVSLALLPTIATAPSKTSISISRVYNRFRVRRIYRGGRAGELAGS